jgi:hypothetical protein
LNERTAASFGMKPVPLSVEDVFEMSELRRVLEMKPAPLLVEDVFE